CTEDDARAEHTRVAHHGGDALEVPEAVLHRDDVAVRGEKRRHRTDRRVGVPGLDGEQDGGELSAECGGVADAREAGYVVVAEEPFDAEPAPAHGVEVLSASEQGDGPATRGEQAADHGAQGSRTGDQHRPDDLARGHGRTIRARYHANKHARGRLTLRCRPSMERTWGRA